MAQARSAFFERLFAQRGGLQAFFHRRLQAKSEAADLVQEVYLRMLRVRDPETIQNPEAYLYTVAGNLLKERLVASRRQGEIARVEEADTTSWQTNMPELEVTTDTARRLARLRVVLGELSPQCAAALLLQYRHGLSYQEIAERLEISPRMVKKYLAQSIELCRRRMARLR